MKAKHPSGPPMTLGNMRGLRRASIRSFNCLGSSPMKSPSPSRNKESRHLGVHLRRGVHCLATLLLLTTNTFAAKMTFERRSSQVRMDNSDWIKAEGDITEESAVELENYLNNRASFSTNKIEYTVVLNSRGGNLIGGIKLGEFFAGIILKRLLIQAYAHQPVRLRL
jgi:hypothetical protein